VSTQQFASPQVQQAEAVIIDNYEIPATEGEITHS